MNRKQRRASGNTVGQIFSLAQKRHKAGNLREAKDLYKKVLAAHPNHPPTLHLLGVLAFQTGALGPAKELVSKALSFDPGLAGAQTDLCDILIKMGDFEAARESLLNTIEKYPKLINAYSNLGFVLHKLNELDEAKIWCERAISIDLAFADAHSVLGGVFLRLGNPKEARKSFERVLALRPADPASRYNIGLATLTLGDFAEGWKGYEARRETKEYAANIPSHPQPYWDGSPLDGKTILLHAEQGVGDGIQTLRYVKQVSARGGKVVVEVQPALAPLAATINEVGTVVPRGEPLPPFDVYASLMSLPYLLGTALDTIPAEVPYLCVDDASDKIDVDHSGKFKVGFVWAGDPTQENDCNRSTDVGYFRPLIDVPNTEFFSLQVGGREDDLLATNFAGNVIALGAKLTDYNVTASAIDQLDLIISVCTSVAHLAGAMGKPVWTLLSFAPDFRWLLEREDSPWYPTMRLFRQPKHGDWSSVFSVVSKELRKLVSGAK